MIRAFYTSTSGLVAQSTKQDIIANNIANAQTSGFKRSRTVQATFAEALQAQVSRATNVAKTTPFCEIVDIAGKVDMTDGALQQTGDMLDFAISGPGAFDIGVAGGTRNGNFCVDKEGYLTTSDGARLQGNNGAIRVPQGDWSVQPDGSISTKNGEIVDKIKIIGGDPSNTRITQGYLEASNVNTLREMVDMITNMRSFEANQKVLTSVDRTLDKLINEAGKV